MVPDAADELLKILGRSPLKFRSAELIASIAPDGLQHLSAEEVRGAVETLLELAMVRATADVETPEFVDDVVRGMQVAVGEAFTESDRARLTERLPRLLEVQSIAAPSKARSLLVDHAHYMCRARIFTDVRPVFGPDVQQSPTTAFVVHTLKLSYHQGSSVRDFFVVLDRRDLDELSDLLERAKRKEGSLQAMLGAAGVDPLQTD